MFSTTILLKASQFYRLNKAVSDSYSTNENTANSNKHINTKLEYSITKEAIENALPTLYQEYAELKELIDTLESCKASFPKKLEN